MKSSRGPVRALALSSGVFAGILLSSALASADVTNGSFESDFSSWTKSGNMEIQSAAPYAPTSGTKLVSFNSGQTTPNGVLSQSFATTPGTQYVLTFDLGALGVGSQQKLQLNVNGSSGLVNQLLTITGPGNSSSKWASQSFPFIANSATTTITFTDVSTVTNGVDLLLDRVMVSDAGTGGPPVLGTNLLTNGSFEAAYNGWTPDGATRIEEPGPPFTTDGQKMLSFNVGQEPVNGKVTQSFATSPGTTYSIQYDFGALGYVAATQTARTLVTGNGILLNQTATINSRPDYVISFIQVSYTFVANSGVSTLTISDASLHGDALDGFVDNVRVIGTSGGGGANTAPVANADSYSTNANTALVISTPGVLGNDTDAQSNPLTAVLVAPPSNGTLALNANGSFTYTPGNNFSGSDSFTYRANDGTLNSNIATATITVNPAGGGSGTNLVQNGSFESDFANWNISGNQVIQSSSPYAATHGSKLVGFNGANTAPNAVLSQSFATVAGQSYTLSFDAGTLSYVSSQQRVQVSADGAGNVLSQLITLNAGTGGNNVWSARTFNFTANSATTTLTFRDQSSTTNGLDLTLDNVKVIATGSGGGSNTAPTAVADSYSTPQGTPLVVPVNGVLVNDTDPQSNPLTAILVSNVAHGTLALNANGSFTYTPAGGYSGGDSFSYKANDGSLDSTPVNVSIVVTPTGGGSVGAFANGSFETGTFAPWTISGGNQYSVLIDSSLPATQGSKLVTFNAAQSPAAGVLTQTFATTPNVTYNISLDLGVLAFNTSLQSVLVSVTGNGSLRQMPFSIAGIGGGKVKWEAYTFPFTANSTSTTLTFTDTSPTTNSIDMLLDNVRVSKADARILTVDSVLAGNVPVTLSPLDNDSAGNGTTLLTRTYSLGTVVNISAPFTAPNGASFVKWVKDSVDYASTPVTSLTMNADTSLVAVYQGGTNPPLGPNILANGSFESLDGSAWATSWGRANSSNRIEQPGKSSGYPTDGNNILSFNVGGTPTNGVASQSFPTTPGTTYTLQLDIGAYGGPNGAAVNQTLNITVAGTGNLLSKSVTLLGGNGNAIAWAPRTYTFTANSATTFLYLADGSASGNGTDLFVDNVRVRSGIQAPSAILVESNPSGKAITVGTPDLSAQTNGTTPFNRNYDTGAIVQMVAPYQNFVKWLKNGQWYATNPSISIVVDGISTYTAVYTETPVVGPFRNGSFEQEFTGWTWSGSQQSVKVKDGLPTTHGLIIVEFNSNNSATDGSIRQTFTTTPGTTYNVLFDVGTKAFNTSNQTLKCQVLNASSVSLASQNYTINGLGPNGDVYYVARSLTFTANSTTSTLIFADQSGTGAGLDLLLDNVRVNAVAPGKATASGDDGLIGAPADETPVVVAATAGTPVAETPVIAPCIVPATEPETRTGFQIVNGKKYRVVTITKPAVPTGRKIVVQVSPDLTQWFSGKKHTTVLVDDATTLKVRDNTPVKPGAKRYIRVKP